MVIRALAAAYSWRFPSSGKKSILVRLLSSAAATTPNVANNSAAETPKFGIYPGGRKINYTTRIDTHPPTSEHGIPIFRIMDEAGNIVPGVTPPVIDRDTCTKAYTHMVRVNVMDGILYESQRQGRISFYMTSWGEEATHIGSAMALADDDEVFAQYREQGVILWRGFSLQQVADQCFSNIDDLGKGRQMPVHYGSAAHHFQTISSPLATQIPQAVGAAYFRKLEGKGNAVVCYFGEGAASEGDFHAGMNMATTQSAPIIFFCRNNGFAISTPVAEQYRGDGIAARGIAYGMHTIRVDGNDIWAVYEATKRAREIAVGADGSGTKPVLVEAMTYRESHHSTSDDSTRYRSTEEIEAWRTNANPIKRLRLFMEQRGWWDQASEDALRAEERKAVLTALATAESKPRPPVSELFTDVYGDAVLPRHLEKQRLELDSHLKEHPDHYVLGH